MLPQDFICRMKVMLGSEYEEFEKSYECPKYQALRINPLKTEKEKEFSNTLMILCMSVHWRLTDVLILRFNCQMKSAGLKILEKVIYVLS